jgi:hypothetical protein
MNSKTNKWRDGVGACEICGEPFDKYLYFYEGGTLTAESKVMCDSCQFWHGDGSGQKYRTTDKVKVGGYKCSRN